ncbi:MAG: DUF2807 domain-containing protein [Bacteroidales bacterium]|nr:DUF2807 domain-containing protein [Bacteroidales bacterium]
MKKFFTIAVVMLFAMSLFAQTEKKSFNVSGFEGIDAGGVFEIELVKSDKESLTIETEAEIMPYVKVKVTAGVLRLSIETKDLPSKFRRNMKAVKAYVSVRNLTNINLSGVTKMNVTSAFTTNDFVARISGVSKVEGLNITAKSIKVNLSGASSIDVKAKAETAAFEISGASKANINQDFGGLKLGGSGAARIDITGPVEYAEISYSGAVNAKMSGGSAAKISLEMSGASKFEASDFPVKEMDIKVSGVSKVNVNVTETISVEVSGGSNIRYKGDPQIKKVDISSISTFKKIN